MNEVETLIAQARAFGATLIPLEGNRLKVRASKPLPEDLKAGLKRHKVEILTLLKGQGQAASSSEPGPFQGTSPPDPDAHLRGSDQPPEGKGGPPDNSPAKPAPPPPPPPDLVLTPDLDLLDLPLARLTRPLPVWSNLVQEVIYLVPTEADAWRLLAEGKPAYYPEEVAILLEIKARHSETWREKVQKIHLAKKMFGGVVTELILREGA